MKAIHPSLFQMKYVLILALFALELSGCSPRIFVSVRANSPSMQTSTDPDSSIPSATPSSSQPETPKYLYSFSSRGCDGLNLGVIGPCGDLSGMDFSGRDLSSQDLRGAVFKDANLTHADLSRSDLSSANLRGAKLTGASLQGTLLIETVLTGADFTGTTLDDGTIWTQAGDGGGTVYPAGFDSVSAGIIPEDTYGCQAGANFVSYDLLPRCSGSGCSKMVIVKTSCKHTFHGIDENSVWRNLNRVCSHYGFNAPTTKVNGDGVPEAWDHAYNPSPYTSEEWNPTGAWMDGTVSGGFPGGRIWMQSGVPSWLSVATYPAVSDGQSLYDESNPDGITWESYHPMTGGNWNSISRGDALPGDYVLCGGAPQPVAWAGDVRQTLDANSSATIPLSMSGRGPFTVILTQPKHGTATLVADGQVTYVPDVNWTGLDSFQFRVKDALGNLSEPGTVTLTINWVPGIPLTSGCTSSPAVSYTLNPTCQNCGKMVLVQATCRHVLAGNSSNEAWTNLDEVCKVYGHRAPTTSQPADGSLWSSTVNSEVPYTSDEWNPTYPWMTAPFSSNFPGGRIWMQSGVPSWLSVATYPALQTGDSLFTRDGDIQWESYHPWGGGNSKQISSGTVEVGEYLMCAQ